MASSGGRTVGNILGTGVAAAHIIALLGGEDGKLLVGGNKGIIEGRSIGRTAVTVGVEVRQRVSPDAAKTSQ